MAVPGPTKLTPVTKVPYVYGGTVWVSTADLAGDKKTFLPLYTSLGVKFEHTPAGQRAVRNHAATTVHRGNIGKPKGSV